MKKLVILTAVCCATALIASGLRLKAQTGGGALVVATCGTLGQPYTAGATMKLTVNINGQVCQ